MTYANITIRIKDYNYDFYVDRDGYKKEIKCVLNGMLKQGRKRLKKSTDESLKEWLVKCISQEISEPYSWFGHGHTEFGRLYIIDVVNGKLVIKERG
ncbi:MAG: hypothetical protein ABIL44_01015 [candidate division WOR-3 bacterium]